MASRRELLIGLAQHDLLTPTRQRELRGALDRDVPTLLLTWRAPPQLLALAGIPQLVPDSKRRFGAARTQQLVDTHLTALGLAPVPVRTVSHREAVLKSYDPTWLALLREDEPDLYTAAYRELEPNLVRVLYKAQLPAWAPLATLIEHRTHPFGLAATLDHFRLVFP